MIAGGLLLVSSLVAGTWWLTRTLDGDHLRRLVAGRWHGSWQLYRSARSIPLTGRDIIVADTHGKPLSDTQGLLRIIVPGDTRPARRPGSSSASNSFAQKADRPVESL